MKTSIVVIRPIIRDRADWDNQYQRKYQNSNYREEFFTHILIPF